MTERAAHLADHVAPDVRIRQAGVPDARTVRVGAEWVLTLPHRVRDVLADGRLRFHAASEFDSADVADVLAAASMQGRVALGGTLGALPRGQISGVFAVMRHIHHGDLQLSAQLMQFRA